MAFDLTQTTGYGTGANGAASDPTAQINSYATVASYDTNTIKIGAFKEGGYEKFDVGNYIMLHISTVNGTMTQTTYLGKYVFAKITNKAAASDTGYILTLDIDFTKTLPLSESGNYRVQAITVANFTDLSLSSGHSISPVAFDMTNFYGGIVVINCTGTLTLRGGSINVRDKGISADQPKFRPETVQETTGWHDTDFHSGWENGLTKDYLLLNAGDGAIYVTAKKLSVEGAESRIGGSGSGAQFQRGDGIKGGASILLAAGTISGFNPSLIAKQRGAGMGLGRCYIASATKLRNDEALYSYDTIEDKSTPMVSMNINTFGNGSIGIVKNPTKPVNNYARVTGISTDGKIINYTVKTTNGLAPISAGATVIFHVSKHKNDNNMSKLGKFMLAKVLFDNGNSLTLDKSVNNIVATAELSLYDCQIISLAQFTTLTIDNDNALTPAWNGQVGGIFAAAATDSIDLTNGHINVMDKGNGGAAYGNTGLAWIGNAQDNDILPLGQGHGSVFLLAKNLTMNTNTRIGATYAGHETGSGYDGNRNNFGLLGYSYEGDAGRPSRGGNGWGGYGGAGGYGSNGATHSGWWGQSIPGKQGSHIMIIADKIINFNMYAISTGGGNDSRCHNYGLTGGGAGYGGSGGDSGAGAAGGGYNGGGGGGGCWDGFGGGGSAGWAFIYVNQTTSVDNTGITV